MKIVRWWPYTVLLCFWYFCSAMAQELTHDVRPGSGVTSVKRLSDYFPSLAKTPGDTAVYVMDGDQKGGTVFVAAGTHGNEIAGIMAATVLVEHARVSKGRLIVVPHANNSAVSYVDPKRQGPSSITLETSSGKREFRYGSRLTKPEHQGEGDPPEYRHPNSSEELDGSEARDLDRAYPGKAEGESHRESCLRHPSASQEGVGEHRVWPPTNPALIRTWPGW